MKILKKITCNRYEEEKKRNKLVLNKESNKESNKKDNKKDERRKIKKILKLNKNIIFKANTLHLEIIIVFIILLFLTSFFNCITSKNYVIYAVKTDNKSEINTKNVEEVKDSVANNLNLDEYVNSLNEYVKESGIDEFNLEEISKDLVSGENVDFSKASLKLLNIFGKEIISVFKSSILIFIIIVILAVIDSLQIEEKSDVSQIAKLVCFFAIATISISEFIRVLLDFKTVITNITTLMQIISPFLVAVLIATGAINTVGIIQPLLLFLASLIGFIINYVVVPLISLSVAFNVISRISDDIKLNKMSKILNSGGLWIIGVVFTVFLGILSLESSLSTSVDTLAVKTTQAAVSNFVPVVGKFFSDSFETVVGATKIISKVGGILGVIVVILVVITPVIKIAAIMFIYKILAVLIEPICHQKDVSEYVELFADTYKTLLGILIGVSILFIISIGIILNLAGSVIK